MPNNGRLLAAAKASEEQASNSLTGKHVVWMPSPNRKRADDICRHCMQSTLAWSPRTIGPGTPAQTQTQTGDMANVTATVGRTLALVAVLYAARQYYRNWGATKEECVLHLPGDALIVDPVVQATEAIYIDSPQSTVWALLAQMGQDRDDAKRIRSGIATS